MNKLKRQAGVTLIELIVSIVIISVAMIGVMMVVSQTAGKSADPMIRQQALAIAQAYMEEIFLQPLLDPNGADNGTCEEGPSNPNRPLFDDVNDYGCIADTDGARDQNGGLITNLGAYNVSVTVNAGGATLNTRTDAHQIDVLVTHDGDAGLNIQLTAFRLN